MKILLLLLLGLVLADLQPSFRRLDDDEDNTDDTSSTDTETAAKTVSNTNKTAKATEKKSEDGENNDEDGEKKKEDEEEDEEEKAKKDAEALKTANEAVQSNFKNKLDTSENFNQDKLNEALGDIDDAVKDVQVAKLIKNGPIIELLEP